MMIHALEFPKQKFINKIKKHTNSWKWAQFSPKSFIPRNDDLIDSHQMKNSSDFPLSILIFRRRAHRRYESITKYKQTTLVLDWCSQSIYKLESFGVPFLDFSFMWARKISSFLCLFDLNSWDYAVATFYDGPYCSSSHINTQYSDPIWLWFIFVPFTFSKSHLNDHLPICSLLLFSPECKHTQSNN